MIFFDSKKKKEYHQLYPLNAICGIKEECNLHEIHTILLVYVNNEKCCHIMSLQSGSYICHAETKAWCFACTEANQPVVHLAERWIKGDSRWPIVFCSRTKCATKIKRPNLCKVQSMYSMGQLISLTSAVLLTAASLKIFLSPKNVN